MRMHENAKQNETLLLIILNESTIPFQEFLYLVLRFHTLESCLRPLTVGAAPIVLAVHSMVRMFSVSSEEVPTAAMSFSSHRVPIL